MSRNEELRTKYLVLYDVVKTLASLLNDNVTLLTATSRESALSDPLYLALHAQYFVA